MKNRVLNKLMVGIIMTLVVLATVIPAVSVSASNNAEDKVTITLKKGKVTYDDDTKLTTLEGEPVSATTKSMVIKSNKFLVTKNPVTGKINNMWTEEEFTLERDDGVSATGDAISIDSDNNLVKITGNVRLEKLQFLESFDEDGKQEEEMAVICADNIEIDIDVEDFIAEGKVKVTRGDQSGECDKAYYRSEENALDMEGSVYIVGADGETIRAGKATIYLNSSSFTAEAGENEDVEITFTMN